MVQATDGLTFSTVVDAKAAHCGVCDQPLKFENTPNEVDIELSGLATATHCDKKYIISPAGKFRMTVVTAPAAPEPKTKAATTEEDETPKAGLRTSSSTGTPTRGSRK